MATEYKLRSSAWSIPPRVVAFRGREGISELYRFEVGVLWTSETPFAPEEAVGEPITLEIERDGHAPHRWNGVVEEISLVLEEGSSSYWRVTFGPRLRRLDFTEHSRVFTDVSVPEIVRAVLADEGMPSSSHALGLTGTYAARPHVCQYRESSLDFVRRLAERDGIFWYFDHGEEEEQLQFRDESRSAAASREAVRYVPLAEDSAVAGEALVHFRARRAALSRAVRLHDYDPMRPRLAVTGEAKVARGLGGDVVRWGENVTSPDEAERHARIRSEALVAGSEIFEGHGVVVGLRPGARFGLVEHPALDGEYLVTGLRHRARVGNQSLTILSALGMEELVELTSQYRVDVAAVNALVPYRAPSVTAWPRVAGVVTGVVDGPSSSPYAQIDDEGRYRARLHFDEGDTADGSRSTWVRMLQPHGGAPEGMHFPLRKGTEVAILFLGGDPDRPFILGASPNPEKPSPVAQRNHSQNVIQTGSANRLELEDVAGGQHITLSTPIASSYHHLGAGPKNFVLKTDGRGRTYTGGDLDVDVDVDKTEDVVSTVTETYHQTQDRTVTGPVTELLQTNLSWTVSGPVTHTWTGPFSETVDGHYTETFLSTLDTTVNAALTSLTYAGGLRVTVAGDVVERFTASQTTTVDGPLLLIVGGSVTETFGSERRHIKGTYFLGVAATYKVLTPNMVLKAPGWQLLSNIAKKMVAKLFEVTGVSTSSRGFELDLTKTKTSLTGVSASATGASITLCGIANKNTKPKIDLHGPHSDIIGFKGDQAGFVLVTGGPKLAS